MLLVSSVFRLVKEKRLKSQCSLLVDLAIFRSFRCRRNARSSGLIVASEAAVIPIPVSIADHIANSSIFPNQLYWDWPNAGIHRIRAQDAMKPL
jgi:hypothetical protein